MMLVTLVLSLVPAFAGDDSLILVQRDVDVRVTENVAAVTFQVRVRNGGLKTAEGDLTFRVPPGAAVFRAALRQHIASSERFSKVMDAKRALALYEKARVQEFQSDELRELAAIGTIAARAREGTRQTNAANTVQGGVGNDPALLEEVSRDVYRLRFHPVPAMDEQTVSFTLAFEVARDGATHSIRLPLDWKANFELPTEKTDIRASVDSADLLGTVTSTTHDVARTAAARRFEGSWTGGRNSFSLGYTLGRRARPFDVTSQAWTQTSDPLRSALEALAPRAKDAEPGKVDATVSLLVIERSMVKQLETRAPDARVPLEKADRCDFVRAAAGLPALNGSDSCQVRVVTTNERSKIDWAKAHGLEFRSSPARVQVYEYVRHDWACPVHEPHPTRLKDAAASLKGR